jgi:hypothetical protein
MNKISSSVIDIIANSDGEDSSEMSKDIDWISRVRKYRSDANLKDC